MPRYRLTIEYEGTRYRGWQAQKNARTVQGECEAALRSVLTGAPFDLQGSGRTDAGVHALGQVAHLELGVRTSPESLRLSLNDLLPADIHILEIRQAPPAFHARHHAEARSYLYQISRRRTAFGKRTVWWIKDPLDENLLRQAGALFLGMHDFRSFTDADPEDVSTRVLIHDVAVLSAGALILIRVVASHFLWKMVRRMVGVMAEVGRGSLSLEEAERFLSQASPKVARLTAPPSGLFLERVLYAGDPPLGPPQPVLTISNG
jgi:tRNA pseudouridine38-40 synthase